MFALFVGDKPSRLNLDPNIAFVGTPSHKNLLKWIARMGITEYAMVNSDHSQELYHAVSNCWRKGGRVVALGNNASKRLAVGAIEHFKLPHPSPVNRQLNDQYFIEEQLYKCYSYLTEPLYVQNLRRMGT